MLHVHPSVKPHKLQLFMYLKLIVFGNLFIPLNNYAICVDRRSSITLTSRGTPMNAVLVQIIYLRINGLKKYPRQVPIDSRTPAVRVIL